MVKKYMKQFWGDPEAVEAAIRVMDQVFRRRYNVYGGRREYTGKDPEGNYTVVMSYTADWVDHPYMLQLFPEYPFRSIERSANRLCGRRPWAEAFWAGAGVET